MKRYKVSWIERHSAFVEAENEDQALDTAYSKNPHQTLDSQSIEEIQEAQHG